MDSQNGALGWMDETDLCLSWHQDLWPGWFGESDETGARSGWVGWLAGHDACCVLRLCLAGWRGYLPAAVQVLYRLQPARASPGAEASGAQCKVTYESPAGQVPRRSLVSQIGGRLVGCSLLLGEERVRGFP